MPGSRHRRGFSSLPSCPHISHQMFTIKYSRASSMKFWAPYTCYRVTSWHHTKDPHPGRPFKNEGMAPAAMPGCRYHLKSVWVRVLYILNMFCRGKLPPENCSTHRHLFIFLNKNMKISYNVAYCTSISNKEGIVSSGRTTSWANTVSL